MEAPKNNNPKKNNLLSILVSQDGLSFCFKEGAETEILRKKFDKPLSPEGILKKTRALVEEGLRQRKPNRVVALYANNPYCLVPEAFFDENQLPDYLKFNAKILETDFIAYDQLKTFGFNNVYIPYANINNYFFDLFGEFEYKHSTTVLMESLLESNVSKEETMYAHIGERHFDLIATKGGKLQLCNSFLYETAEDFLYYVLFAAQQLKWDPETFNLEFLGDIAKTSKEYELSYTYIRNCGFMEKDKAPNPDFVLLNAFR